MTFSDLTATFLTSTLEDVFLLNHTADTGRPSYATPGLTLVLKFLKFEVCLQVFRSKQFLPENILCRIEKSIHPVGIMKDMMFF